MATEHVGLRIDDVKIEGGQAILTDRAAELSGLPNPIDLATFDLHAARVEADETLSRLQPLVEGDPSELLVQDRATAPQNFERAMERRRIIRGIAGELAMRAHVFGDVDPDTTTL